MQKWSRYLYRLNFRSKCRKSKQEIKQVIACRGFIFRSGRPQSKSDGRERQTNRQTGRQAGKQTDIERQRQTERETERDRDRQRETDRQTDRQGDRLVLPSIKAYWVHQPPVAKFSNLYNTIMQNSNDSISYILHYSHWELAQSSSNLRNAQSLPIRNPFIIQVGVNVWSVGFGWFLSIN